MNYGHADLLTTLGSFLFIVVEDMVKPEALPYSKPVAKRIRELIRDGVSVTVILDSIQSYQNAPKSTATLYKIYGQDIAEERAAFHQYLGGKARQRIEEGSDKILELALRSKAGWNPSIVVEEKDSDAPDENSDAISTLMTLLGKTEPDDSTSDSGDTEEPAQQ